MKEMPSEKIRNAVPVSEYVRRKFPDVKLTGRRGVFRGPCPIHGGSNNTAFSIDDNKKQWTCFGGCGSGSIIDLWLKTNNKGQSDVTLAMERLNEEMGLGLQLSDKSDNAGLSRSQLAKSVESVCRAAHDRLMARKSADAREAYEYLTSRGLDDHDITEWCLGVLPDKKSVVNFMTSAATKSLGSRAREALEETQLLERSQFDDKQLYSQLSERITFPIRDEGGSFLGISARILPSHESEKKKDGKKKSKYINTRSTSLFDKSKTMYGMHNARLFGKDKTTTVFVCEGQMDVISLSWILNDDEIVTATCGTALTEQHMEWLANFAHVYLVFDSDEAGRRAVLKALPIVNFCGSKNVRSITLTSGKDANEIAQRDEDALIDDVETNSIPLMHEVARVLWSQAHESPSALYASARESLESIKRSVDRQKLIDALEQASGLPGDDISREVTMSALPARTRRATDADDEHVSDQIAPLCAWLSTMDTMTRKSLLIDLDTWLESGHVREIILGAVSETDCDVLTYLSIGREMRETHSDARTERAEHIVAQLSESDNNSPAAHLNRMARLLQLEIKRGTLGREHLRLLNRVLSNSTDMSEISAFSALSEIFDELVK